ncbi:NAD(P)-dependent oxidoreductase [Thermoactinomyces sp. DSM 45892]|uniref:NAD-dependent epimerase/dehydratase family protein n=1 Tax=Thermoactinomyces sp. DSM 45892 TaxID=1882753 RepID=UPI00089D42B3|nr:NAD(P)-dependent oxidoreductase [Thermoactinomyces sp. DSM 45892]SDZ04645.1 Nucleoside-diphosphate-sugar epimerase [Thermoactinomyces sp. DSM 45892]
MSIDKWIFITGANGFVAQHLIQKCLEEENTQIVGVGRSISRERVAQDSRVHYQVADLTNSKEMDTILRQHSWKRIYHLAGENRADLDHSNVWKDNVYASLLFLDALRKLELESLESVVMIGTAMEYQEQEMVITENSIVEPTSSYGWSKHLVTSSAQWFARKYHLPIICVRPFNLIGPGAKEGIIPWIAQQLKAQYPFVELPVTIHLRSLGGIRDYIDVRDAVQALYMLSEKASICVGDCYQICSQKGVSVSQLVSTWEEVIQYPIKVITQNMTSSKGEDCFIGSYEKIRRFTGWKPTYTLIETLSDLWKETFR